ncbi:UNVERIFIED_CONTAM: Unconventional myosin-XV [Trichonephila clavipes]
MKIELTELEEDAIAKALYSSLFSWLVQRVNNIVFKGPRKTSIAILDIFGFEDFKENSFEQLCINYANETLQYYFNKHVFKLEQQEYAKERIEWQPINYQDNQPVLNLIAKKPVGILPLLDDESNFPKPRFSKVWFRDRNSNSDVVIKLKIIKSVNNHVLLQSSTLRVNVKRGIIPSKIRLQIHMRRGFKILTLREAHP